MKKSRLFFSGLALFFGLVVVAVSLASANRVVSYGGSTSAKSFYLSGEILPDHLAYPLVAAVDQIILIAAPLQEKIKLQLAYCCIRLDYSRGLLAKGQSGMAMAALTKSQKYCGLAAQQILDHKIQGDLRRQVANELAQNIEFNPDQCSFANQLNQHSQLLLDQLEVEQN
jgi:hypothetical protein